MRVAIHLQSRSVNAWTLSPAQAARLADLLPEFSITNCQDETCFVDALRGAHIAIAWNYRQEWIDVAENLRVLATPAAGRDYFSLNLPPQVVTINGSFHGKIMAQTALGLLLAHARALFLSDRLMKGGQRWPRREYDRQARTLCGARVTILGFGNIGREIGRLCKLCGARICGVRRSWAERPEYFGAEDMLISPAELPQVLPGTDHLVLVLPAGEQTDGVVNRELLRLLPPHAALYNFGRGNAVDEGALLAALAGGELAGAYLDVYAQEPLPEDSPLRGRDDVVLLPHASAIAPEYLDLFIDEFAAKIRVLQEEGRL